MRDDARLLLQTALPRVAHQIEAIQEAVPISGLGEKAHLLPATKAALEAAAEDLGLPATVRTEHPFRCVEWESSAGVDVAICGLTPLAPVFLELKWGYGPSILGECSWDLAKMGLAVAKRACSAAALLAGAPRKRWEQVALEGPELFVTGRHDLAHVRGPQYLDKYWKYYAREGLPQPQKLPTSFRIKLLESLEMEFGNDVWDLRCAEVLPASELVAVERLPTA